MGFLGSFDMLFLVLQANYFEKISLMGIFSLVNPNAPGLNSSFWRTTKQVAFLNRFSVHTVVWQCTPGDVAVCFLGNLQVKEFCKCFTLAKVKHHVHDGHCQCCRGVFITDSVLSGNLLPLNLLGASRYFRENFDVVFLKIVNCDFRLLNCHKLV